MPKNRPATGDTGWGNTLNAHLNQLMPAGGGVNFGATRPTLTASDDGYTMIDTTTREVIRWNGTAWVILMGGFTEGKPQLTANTNLYINKASGNDGNNGRTAATAYKTLNRAVREAYNLDLNGFGLIINIAGGVYTNEIFDFSRPLIGATGSFVQILGAGSATTEIITNDSFFGSAGCITNAGSNSIRVDKVKLSATGTSGNYIRGLLQVGPGIITVGEDVNFGNVKIGTNSQHMYVEGGVIYIGNPYTVSGSATMHMAAGPGGNITSYTSGPHTSNFSGSGIAFDIFAAAVLGLCAPNVTFSNPNTVTATVRTQADYNGVVVKKANWPGTVDNQYNGGIVTT